jgi:L-threonylcarbamoyladenylate synthase
MFTQSEEGFRRIMRRISAISEADQPAALAEAVDVLRRGGIVAYPTDTLYGLAVDPGSEAAMQRLFDVKGRDRSQAIPLIAADLAQASAAGDFTAADLRLAQAFWPGPLSLVVEATSSVARFAAADDGTVAVRIPDHPLARGFAAAFGTCITATSANLSGRPATVSPDDVAASIGDRIDLLLDGGASPGGPPSTIVRLRDGAPVLVRAGAIAWERVLESLQEQP